jgi:hypothetical protein
VQGDILLVDARTEKVDLVARLPGMIGGLGTARDGRRVWACWFDRSTDPAKVRLSLIDVASGSRSDVAELRGRADQIAGWCRGEQAIVVSDFDTASLCGDGPPRVLAEIAGYANQLSVGWNGSVFAVTHTDVEVYPPLEEIPDRTLPIDALLSWEHGHLLAMTRATVHSGARGRLVFPTERAVRSFIGNLAVLGRLHGAAEGVLAGAPEPERPHELHVSPGGRYAAWWGDGRLELIDLNVATVKVLADVSRTSAPVLAWSPSGRKLAYAYGKSVWLESAD